MWHPLGSDAYTILKSTPDRVEFEVPMVPGQRQMFLRLKFQR
jgi:hypothetical protein